METKTVYSFDPATRSYLGALTLSEADGDMSPVEPGVWHIPGNCLEVPPPENVPAGKYAAAGVDGWEIRDVPVPVGAVAVKAAAGATHAERKLAPPEQAAMLHMRVQQHLDALARTQRFNDMAEAVTYIGSPVLKYALQAEALRVVRDRTWAIVEPLCDAIADGAEPVKFNDLAPTLPVYDGVAVEQAIAESEPDYEPEPPPAALVVPPLPPITQEFVDAANAAIALQANEKIVTAATSRARKSKKA